MYTNIIKDLIEKLNIYRDAYYNKNKSIISDHEYDALYDKLQNLEEQTGIIYSNSPTQTVGYSAVSNLNKVKHNHPLLSLNKTTEMDKIIGYFKGHDSVIMAKLDGLTCSLLYRNGNLVQAESRGNGEIGEDITNNVKAFSNVPLHIPYKGELIVDGECIIDYDTFEWIKKRENTDYKNPRNLVSGTVRQLDNSIVANRKVKFIAWRLYSAKGGSPENDDLSKSISKGFGYLANLGFSVVPYLVCRYDSMDDKTYEAFYTVSIGRIRSKCKHDRIPIDGIVSIFDDIEYGEELGSTGHHPKHSLAYKFYQDENETTLIDIEWNTSRTGLINPVAVFEPIEIDGTTVTRATLNNVSIIKDLELGIGDKITIIKANQIIPQVKSNLTRSNTYTIPETCPSCGSRADLRSDNGRWMLFCTNPKCKAVKHDRIANFASREGMNIVGISDERLLLLMEAGLISDFASIYKLEQHRDVIEKMPGFGKKSVNNLIKAINESRECSLINFIVAIGITGVGKSSAKIIANYCIKNCNTNYIEFLIQLANNNHNWAEMESFGKSTSDSINQYIKMNEAEIRGVAKFIRIRNENTDKEYSDNLFGGKTFCITGKLTRYSNRDELVSDIEKHGGKIVSGVTAKTNYLITNDPFSGSGKNEKAKKFGTNIISEDEFLTMKERTQENS